MANARSVAFKLIGTLRDSGTLLSAGAAVPVTYQIGLVQRGSMELATGEIEGKFSPKMVRRGPARLTLADGHTVVVTLSNGSADLAAIEADKTGAAYCHALWAARDANAPQTA
jgi:hypothetical protein